MTLPPSSFKWPLVKRLQAQGRVTLMHILQRVAEALISKIFVDVEFHQTSKYYLVWMTHAWNMWKRRPSFFIGSYVRWVLKHVGC
jgi:hypothetical protein